MLTVPVGMATGVVATTQLGSVGISVTEIPGEGAAVGTPLLSKLMEIEVPKLWFSAADACTMLSDAVVVAAVTPSM